MAQIRFICRSVRSRPTPSGAPLWRLVGANNRELGRAPATIPDTLRCSAAIFRLKEKLPEASARIRLVGLNNSTWTWSIEYDGEVLAVSGRAYLRQRECQYSLWQFIAAVPAAAVTDHSRSMAHGAEEVSMP